jgi:hypothetical protein
VVAGWYATRTVWGLRTALRADVLLGIACIEVAHQYVDRQGEGLHEIQLGFGLDLGLFIGRLSGSL